jgi:peptidoglycan/xylan/chitin deacetylase (PgdA/CDA1 family)
LVLLSFDIEEFDMPLEYNKEISFEDQMEISIRGTNHILDILDKHQIKATFFSTVIFAQNAPEVIKRLLDSKHELASHGYFHSAFDNTHLALSRKVLQAISSQDIIGFRMPRMKPVDENEVRKAGYLYNSSINPTWIPGRYNNLSRPRTIFETAGIWQIPASVSPILRFPLFWLSFHNLPLAIYVWLSKITHKKDGYLNIYFHPWEFTDLNDKERFGFPGYVSKNSGTKMIERMDKFIAVLKKKNYTFGTLSEFININ